MKPVGTCTLKHALLAGAGFLPIALALSACSSQQTEAAPAPTAAAIVPPSPAPAAVPVVTRPAATEPKKLGAFEITFYYVIGEEEIAKKPVPNDNHSTDLASISEPSAEVSTIYDAKCEPIAQVQPEFASALALQGTGKLNDGRVLNIWGNCSCPHSPCFQVTANQWGTAGSGKPLQPFRTVAVDPKVIKVGSWLYVPLLEGRTMPGRAPWGGFVHDGCVIADDTGGGIDGHQLDLFVGRHAYFLGLSGQEGSHSWARHAEVFDGSEICARKDRKVTRTSGSI